MIGRKLAHFTITGKLGQGGMGVVYEAHDGHLDRAVALKLLPHDALANPARKQRFVQEAKSASALNHPQIVTIYDIDSEDGIDYIAMELIRGRTLEQALARGKLRLAEALKYGVQIADALAAAHAAGIVHRDLKPGNIMITERGDVKVLDFGLAKLTGAADVSEQDETRTQQAVTEQGSVVGSAPYMSPEQAEGRRVDARSDIFSFGSVLYEMLTGKRAFQGGNRTATMASILKDEPEPVSKSVPDVPREVERVVTRCLRKDVDRRSQSMAEIRVALQDLKDESESGSRMPAPAAIPSRARQPWRHYAAGAALAATVLAAVWFRGPARSAPTIMPFTSNGSEYDPAFSADGNLIAFAGAGPNRDNFDIYVQQIGAGSPLRLTTDPGADRSPVFSPDGRHIAFTRVTASEGTLILIPALGGAEQRLGPVFSPWIDFSPDGKTIALSGGEPTNGQMGIVLVSVENGARKRLTSLRAASQHIHPRFSPDGRTVAFVHETASYQGDVDVVSVDGGEPKVLSRDNLGIQGLGWMPEGREIVFASKRGRRSQLSVVSASGGAARSLFLTGDGATAPAISRRGARLAYAQSSMEQNIWRLDIPHASEGASGSLAKLIGSTRYQGEASYSPDGIRIAFSSDRSGNDEIWVAKADGADAIQLTSLGGHSGSPRWSPDGRRLVFDFAGNEKPHLYVIDADGGVPRRLTTNRVSEFLGSWSGNGHWIYFCSDRTGRREVWRIPAEGGQETQVTREGGNNPKESPDGKVLFFSGNGSLLWRISLEGGLQSPASASPVQGSPRLSGHGWQAFDEGVYFLSTRNDAPGTGQVQFFDFASRRIISLGRLEKPYQADALSVSPDRRHVIFTQTDRNDSDIMLVENFH